MKKSTIIILIGVLTLTSLLLALPFKPLRSSFESKAGIYVNKAMQGLGVDFNGRIKNARLIARSRQYDVTGLDVPAINGGNHRVTAGGRYSGLNKNAAGGIAGTYGNKYQNQHQGNAGGVDAGLGISSNNKSSSNTSTSEVQVGGLTSESSKPTGGSTVRQAATKQNYSPGQGGTHPGLDPTGSGPNPSQPMGTLPVGNGTGALLLFAVVLTGIKAKRLTTV